jgi:hypothetical protein
MVDLSKIEEYMRKVAAERALKEMIAKDGKAAAEALLKQLGLL